MLLPTPLQRNNPNVHKNDFGHVLIIAGSAPMLGATALCALSAMRSGAGLTTAVVAKSLNRTLHAKLSPIIMTLPVDETKEGGISFKAWSKIQFLSKKCSAIAIGPGLGKNKSTARLLLKLISSINVPMVIDADALNILSESDLTVLRKTSAPKILTPHPGEMARLCKTSREKIEANRLTFARDFAQKHNVILLLKGPRTLVVDPKGNSYINKTGNAGMATAGSGDVLTGIIVGLLAQGIEPFQAACLAAHLHGKAGDLAANSKSKASLIATDIIDLIPKVLQILQ